MLVAPPGDQTCNYCKRQQLLVKFRSNASTWWPKLEVAQVAPPGGQFWNKCKWPHPTRPLKQIKSCIHWKHCQRPQDIDSVCAVISTACFHFICRDDMRYEVNILGSLCLWLWQCLKSISKHIHYSEIPRRSFLQWNWVFHNILFSFPGFVIKCTWTYDILWFWIYILRTCWLHHKSTPFPS